MQKSDWKSQAPAVRTPVGGREGKDIVSQPPVILKNGVSLSSYVLRKVT